MGKAARASIKPTPMPPPVGRNTKGRPIGNFPDGVRPMTSSDKTYEPTPPRPKAFK